MLRKKTSGLAAAAAAILFLIPPPAAGQTEVVMLWPNGAPGSEQWTQKEFVRADFDGGRIVQNVVKPSINVYLPPVETATGTAAIIAPGGAFRLLAWDNEGTKVAEWLQKRGVAAFVLKYRLTDSGTEEQAAAQGRGGAAPGPAGRGGAGPGAPGRAGGGNGRGVGGGGAGGGLGPITGMAAADGLRAIEVVRQHAAEWRIDPDKVGIIGFSAGGYVAVQTGLEHTAANRPAFIGSIYTCCENAADMKVPADAPPAFFLHAYNDPISASSPSLFLAWKAANRPAELHTYADGGHGFGMRQTGRPSDTWIERFGDWLRYQKLMR